MAELAWTIGTVNPMGDKMNPSKATGFITPVAGATARAAASGVTGWIEAAEEMRLQRVQRTVEAQPGCCP